MSAFVSPLQLGYFHSSNRIYRAFNTLYSPISVSFFPIFSSIDQKNKTRLNLLKKYLILLVIMGIAFFSLTFFFADYIIIFLFGSKFSSASETLKLFSFVLPLTAFSNALGRQWLMAKNKDLYYSISLSISSIIALIFFIFFVKTIGINAFPISLIIFESLSIIIISYFLFAND
jgi:O-antigen/teichoic acid export membrane protein